MVGQCYDGAAVMRGIHGGVQRLIREVAPLSYYIHCHAHRLNLLVVAVCTNLERVTDMLLTLRSLHKFFSVKFHTPSSWSIKRDIIRIVR